MHFQTALYRVVQKVPTTHLGVSREQFKSSLKTWLFVQAYS